MTDSTPAPKLARGAGRQPADAGFRVEPADYAIDFKDLRAIREPVFVLEQQVPLEEEWDALDPQCQHVIARDAEHRPIGTGRLTPERKIGRMAVLRAWRGKGVGEALLLALVERARALGWPEVSLNAQVGALGFYEKFGFAPYGARFEEAGIQHQAMRLALAPVAVAVAAPSPARPRPASVRPDDYEGLEGTLKAVRTLANAARRDLVVYTRDLEPAVFADPGVVDAIKAFAITRRGGTVRILLQDPASVQRQPHPLVALAQRLPSSFAFRTPQDAEELQYPSVYVANDADGYLFRLLGSRHEGDWSPALPGRSRQLMEQFQRSWERARPTTELRSLAL
jgi:predicted GNAT family N-acyltransferase